MVVPGLFMSWLLIGLVGFSIAQLYPPGQTHRAGGPAPACSGCYCTAQFPAAEVAVARDIQYGLAANYRPRPGGRSRAHKVGAIARQGIVLSCTDPFLPRVSAGLEPMAWRTAGVLPGD